MSTTRIKSNGAKRQIRTRDEMESLIGEISSLKINEIKIKADLDTALQSVRERYESGLTAIGERLEEDMTAAREWAEDNYEEAFGARKSIEMLHATVGWRLGNPTLKTISGWKWIHVLEELKRRGIAAYIRIKEEINKQAIIDDRDELGASALREMGVKIEQVDEFFVEPKLTDTERRETVEAK